MSVLAVVDTNVLVAALLSKKRDTGVVKVWNKIFYNSIIPLWHDDIVAEYDKVFHKKKFDFPEFIITGTINIVKNRGIYTTPVETEELPTDPDDIIFWQIAMAERKNNAYLITGNKKHYPVKDFVVTSSEMIEILELQ